MINRNNTFTISLHRPPNDQGLLYSLSCTEVPRILKSFLEKHPNCPQNKTKTHTVSFRLSSKSRPDSILEG